MKKVLFSIIAIMLAVFMLASCGKQEEDGFVDKLANAEGALAREDGKLYFNVGGYIGWAESLSEKNVMKPTSVAAVKALDAELGAKLEAKNPKYLYYTIVTMGDKAAGYTKFAMINGVRTKIDGCFAAKAILGGWDEEDENYTVTQWIPNAHNCNAEALTSNFFFPQWSEVLDDNGFSWADDPVLISGAGQYYFILADYDEVSVETNPNQVSYGFAFVKIADITPAEDLTVNEAVPYEAPTFEGWSVIGAYDGHNWDHDTDLEEVEGVLTATVTLAAGDEIKVRENHLWTNSLGYNELTDKTGFADNNNNVVVSAGSDGTYKVTVNGDGSWTLVKQS